MRIALTKSEERCKISFCTYIDGFIWTPGDGPVGAAPILPIIPPQSAERWKNNGNEITRIFNDVLLELMVSQVGKMFNSRGLICRCSE